MTTTTGSIASASGGWSMPKSKMLESEDDLFNAETGELETPMNAGNVEQDDKEPASHNRNKKPIKGGNANGTKKLIVGHRERFLEGLENFIRRHLGESIVFSDERRKNISALAQEISKLGGEYLGGEYTVEHIEQEIRDALNHGDKDPEKLIDIIHTFIGHRWLDAEQYIMKDPKCAYWYTKNILSQRKDVKRWPEAEEYIKTNPLYAYKYAKNIIGERWPEAEEYIKANAEVAFNYAKDVIGGRFEEAEPEIFKNIILKRQYQTMFRLD